MLFDPDIEKTVRKMNNRRVFHQAHIAQTQRLERKNRPVKKKKYSSSAPNPNPHKQRRAPSPPPDMALIRSDSSDMEPESHLSGTGILGAEIIFFQF